MDGSADGGGGPPIVEYAESSSLPFDPLPAMRRLRAVALLSVAGTALWTVASLNDLPLEFHQEFGGLEVLWKQSLLFWVPFVLPAFAAVCLATAALLWHPTTLRTARPVAVLALTAAGLLLIEEVVALGRLANHGVLSWFGNDTYVFARAIMRWGMEGALAVAVGWAALRPTRFSESHLLLVAAVVSLLFGVSNADSVARHVSQTGFLPRLLDLRWITQTLEALYGIAASLLFLLAIRQGRRGGRAWAAHVASWMLMLLMIWLCALAYGIWRPDWATLGATRRLLVVLAVTGSFISILAAGFAYLTPLKTGPIAPPTTERG